MQGTLLAAAILVLHGWGQDLPAIAAAGGAAQTLRPPAPRPAAELPPLPVTQIDARDTTLNSPRRVTLSFLEPRPIDEALALLTAGTPFSVSIDADAKGSFRGELKRLTVREALTTMLAPLGLEFDVRGTIIRVRRRQPETRLFDLNLLSAQRRLARTAGGDAGTVTLATSVANEDAIGGIADGVRALLSDSGRVHVDARAGVAQVTDSPERLDRVAVYLETLHRRSGRQVRLQAQVFEVVLRDRASIDWNLVRQGLGLRGDVPDAGLAADPAALRDALIAQGEVRTLWAPDVTTLNNEPAMVRVSSDGGTSLTMTVVPQISADGVVQLSLSHAWQDHGVTESDTVTRVMDGNTVLVSGLMRPLSAAGATGTTSARAELVVLLRPTVVGPGVFTAGGRQ